MIGSRFRHIPSSVPGDRRNEWVIAQPGHEAFIWLPDRSRRLSLAERLVAEGGHPAPRERSRAPRRAEMPTGALVLARAAPDARVRVAIGTPLTQKGLPAVRAYCSECKQEVRIKEDETAYSHSLLKMQCPGVEVDEDGLCTYCRGKARYLRNGNLNKHMMPTMKCGNEIIGDVHFMVSTSVMIVAHDRKWWSFYLDGEHDQAIIAAHGSVGQTELLEYVKGLNNA